MNYMILLSFSFQVAGSSLLVQMFFSRKEKDILELAKTIIPTSDFSPALERILFETLLARFGFGFLLLGYIFQFISLNQLISLNLETIICFISFSFFIWFLGFILSKKISKKLLPQYQEHFKKKPSNYEVRWFPDEQEKK